MARQAEQSSGHPLSLPARRLYQSTPPSQVELVGSTPRDTVVEA